MRKLVAVLMLVTMSATVPWTARPVEASPGAGLRIVDASDPTKTTPVVNEGGKLQLKVVDGSGNTVAVSSWSTDNKSVGKVNREHGVLKGKTFGFATITARTSHDDVSGFIVVARVRTQTGAMTQGDTKTDTGGNVYLSSPTRHVLYKASGLSAEVFAGHVDQSGYQDGTGDGIRFNGPSGIGVDNRAEGGLYIADTMNDCIRKVDFRERSSLAAGVPGFAGTMHGDENPIAEAVFDAPRGVASVGSNLYVTDTNNDCIWYVDVQRQVVELVAGEPGEAGNATGQGRAARFDHPSGITINTRGNFLAVADTGNNVVKLVAIAPRPGTSGGVIGNVTTLGLSSSSRNADILEQLEKDRGTDAIEFDQPVSVSFDGVDNVYVIDNQTASVVTRPPITSGRPVERVDLAQVGTLGNPASITVRRTQAFVLNESPASEQDALSVVEVGAPTITSLSDDTDNLGGGEVVTITGTNFAPESKLTLGDSEVNEYSIRSSTEITFVVPSQQAPGGRTLTIVTRGGVAQVEFDVLAPELDNLAVGSITTIAGGIPYIGDGGLAASLAGLSRPEAAVVDGLGNLFIADTDNHRIRRVDAISGVITTYVGTGEIGYGGDGGPSAIASLASPRGIAIDGGGNLFIADTNNNRIRRVDSKTNSISTVAGNGDLGYGGDGGPAVTARLYNPWGLAIDNLGNLYIADTIGNRIRRVDSYTGVISTLAGVSGGGYGGDGGPATLARLLAPRSVALDFEGRVLIADTFNHRIRRVDLGTMVISTVVGTGMPGFGGNGGPGLASLLQHPSGVAVDSTGNIYIADLSNNRIRRVDGNTNVISTFAGTGSAAIGPDGVPATSSALYYPRSVALDGNGDLVVGDTYSDRIRVVDAGTRRIATLAGSGVQSYAGDGAVAVRARFYYPTQAKFDFARNLLIVDMFNSRIRKVSAQTGLVSTIVGNGNFGFNGDGHPAVDTSLAYPTGLAYDGSGGFYIADSYNNRVRHIDSGGRVTTFAGGGIGGDGSLATDAQLNHPTDVAVSPSGNLLIADTANHKIRAVDPATGRISTVAGTGDQGSGGDGGRATSAQLRFPYGLAIDLDGSVVIADTYNNTIRRIDLQRGIITRVAGGGLGGDGGPAVSARLLSPRGIAIDGAGTLFIADTGGNRVRRVDRTSGIITTVAGSGVLGYRGDGGPSTNARLANPYGLEVDAAGNLFICDWWNHSVRVVKGIAVPRN